jgi:6-phosphogluconolactonase (cycloisomerase 2 family)
LAVLSFTPPLFGQFVYVANDGGNVSAYTINASTGALMPILGSPFGAGGGPFSVAVDPTGRFAYVTNQFSDDVSGYTINATTGALTAIPGSPFATGLTPLSVAVDPAGKFAYVANDFSSDVSGYTINATTGALTPIPGSPFPAGLGPFSVAVDPTGKFAYVANLAVSNVSGYTINPTTGALTPIPGSPFPSGLSPSSVAVDPTGKFAYVANDLSNDVSGYTINATTGALAPVPGSPFAAGFCPTSVTTTPLLMVQIDVKPGEDPPTINPKSQGKITVAILSSPAFNAPAEVATTSLTFGRTGSEHSLAFCNPNGEDGNGDGLVDLVCHFNTQTTGFQTGDTVGILKGKTVNSVPIRGTDSIIVK